VEERGLGEREGEIRDREKRVSDTQEEKEDNSDHDDSL